MTLGNTFKGYCDIQYHEAMGKAIMESWVWLEREGLVAPRPGDPTGDWIFVTRRGREFRKTGDFRKFKASQLLPLQTLDPQLAARVTSAFLRGEYDLAVFAAFREVEIVVRELGGYAHGDVGVPLMRKAFDPNGGPLTNPEQEAGEKQSVGHLYAGAIGLFKNPSSHRDINLNDPIEAIELIMLADALMRMAKRRKASAKS